MSDNVTDLQLLDDLPVGPEEDQFQHALYADMLASILSPGKPGRCVGLFGKWGQGKSTVARLLKEKLAGETLVITFNAWKSSGDSIRRQLLLHVLSIISPEEAARLKRFVGVEVAEELLLTGLEKKHKRAQAWRKTIADWCLWVKLSPMLTITLSLFSLGFIFVILSLTHVSEQSGQLLQIALSLLFPAGFGLAIYIQKTARLRYLGHLSIGQPLSESQKLKYPEQFKDLFVKHVDRYCKNYGDLIVVVDDLDRCNASTIAEALAAIRQFTPDELANSKDVVKDFRCQFLVPCDEIQVVFALETAGHDAGSQGARFHDYQSEELLRKFFDVTIRMHDMLPDDLSDYAAKLAEAIELEPQEGREIVALVGPEDPRLVKKLLNALRLSHERVKRAQANEVFPSPDDLPDFAQTERLLVALRETEPQMYARIAEDPSLLVSDDAGAWAAFKSKDLAGAAKRARSMINASGSVSPETAEVLIHGKLPILLYGVPGAGNLVRSLRRFDHEVFRDVLSNLDPEGKTRVRQWLCQEASRVSAAAALNRILSLFAEYATSDAKADFIAPCVDATLRSRSLLQQALSDQPSLMQLEVLLPRLTRDSVQAAHQAIVETFTTSEGKSDSELRFLLATCNRMDKQTARCFRSWLVASLDKEGGSDEFVARIAKSLPDDRDKCSGFAPEAGVLAASRSKWENAADRNAEDTELRWLRHDVVITLVGEFEQHAAQCLNAILTGAGQLASPQSLGNANSGIRGAWKTVEDLLPLVSDSTVQKAFNKMHSWLNQPQSGGFKLVLDTLGDNAFRLSANQTVQLAQSIVGRLTTQPQEIHPVEFIGAAPVRSELGEGWQRLTSEVSNRYANWLANRPTLSRQESTILSAIHKFRWPAAEAVENLLLRKIQASNVPQFRSWLDPLVPLVGNRRVKIREKVLEGLEKGHNVECAFSAGLAVLWTAEIDAESGAAIGRFFMINQSRIPQFRKVWDSLQGKEGAGTVLEVMQDLLPSEVGNLKPLGNALDMLVDGFKMLDIQHKRGFLNKTLHSLILSPDSTARQKGLDLASRVPEVSTKLRKQLQSLQKERGLSAQQEKVVELVVKKPLVRKQAKSGD